MLPLHFPNRPVLSLQHDTRAPRPLQNTAAEGAPLPAYTLTFRHVVEVQTTSPLFFSFTYPHPLSQVDAALNFRAALLGDWADTTCPEMWPRLYGAPPSRASVRPATSTGGAAPAGGGPVVTPLAAAAAAASLPPPTTPAGGAGRSRSLGRRPGGGPASGAAGVEGGSGPVPSARPPLSRSRGAVGDRRGGGRSASGHRLTYDPTAVFFSREVLTHSLEGRPVELVTISSWEGVPRVDTLEAWLALPREPPIAGLFPYAANPAAVVEARDGGTDSGGDSSSRRSEAGGGGGGGGGGGTGTLPPLRPPRGVEPSGPHGGSMTPTVLHSSSGGSGATDADGGADDGGDSRPTSPLSDPDSEFGEEAAPPAPPSSAAGAGGSGVGGGLPSRPAAERATPRDAATAAPTLRPPAGLFAAGKRVVVLSARVHPGETPGSFAMDGMLDLLCDAHDPRAQELRRRFVFLVLPHLNPDGVARGHWRLDTRGVNLNRCYIDPTPDGDPTAYALRVRAPTRAHVVSTCHRATQHPPPPPLPPPTPTQYPTQPAGAGARVPRAPVPVH